MSVAASALRHSRAAVLLAAALVVAGVISALSLPSSIYPPLQFPRIAIIAHSGTLPPQSMMLTVTRPLEQAALEVPGIRRVRSRSIRGAAEISAQFDPATDMANAGYDFIWTEMQHDQKDWSAVTKMWSTCPNAKAVPGTRVAYTDEKEIQHEQGLHLQPRPESRSSSVHG